MGRILSSHFIFSLSLISSQSAQRLHELAGTYPCLGISETLGRTPSPLGIICHDEILYAWRHALVTLPLNHYHPTMQRIRDRVLPEWPDSIRHSILYS